MFDSSDRSYDRSDERFHDPTVGPTGRTDRSDRPVGPTVGSCKRRIKLKFGERAFAVAAPKAWNSLPDSPEQINDTVKFGKDLKTHLFNLAYN